MKTRWIVATALLAVVAAPAQAAMSGIPHELKFWLLESPTPSLHENAFSLDRLPGREAVEPTVPGLVTAAAAAISGVPKEVQAWLLRPASPEPADHQPSRTTTGEAR
jgi:hypothetical protein